MTSNKIFTWPNKPAFHESFILIQNQPY